ncbi:OmpA family protein [Neolewinella lacunae]|uniref:PD40 domain-containing protein n=1 Tax=Neolewinella lacunae TaxID=1517758 RepID=A0A923PLQ5_9BACT|nr:OmpA family protein [Neolewinella lacunae]MBC6996360.1 PD40 domain-containing protein [Neolewinella lacunae]MDN3636983.1 OmpA family protein [Neolewinella lacunae]
MRHSYHTLLICLFCVLSLAVVEAQTPVASAASRNVRERDPLLRADGREVFFTRPDFANNKGVDNAADIWTRTRYADGSWGRALNPGSPINTFGHDRAIGISPDGTRLAALRSGASNYIDLLEINGRNWRILESWPLPSDVKAEYGLSFDANAQRLFYSAPGYDGSLDLFLRFARADGEWSEATALRELNGPGQESSPRLATDGRTLYFRRNDREWLRQTEPGGPATVVDIPGSLSQFTFSLDATGLDPVVVLGEPGQERLYSQTLPRTAAPPPAALTRGYLPSPPLPGELTAGVAIAGAAGNLHVRPDAMLRYAVFLREGESLVVDGQLPAVPQSGPAAGGLANVGGASVPSPDQVRLEAGIAQRERELRQLDEARRQYDLAMPKTADEELLELRRQFDQASRPAGDTLPPQSTAKGTAASRERFARELAELERMKEKFRRQQDEKLRQQNRTGNHRWTETEAPATTTPAAAAPDTYAAPSAGSISDYYRSAPDPALARQQAYADSLRLQATVRNNLYGNQQPKVYERQPWENELRRDLPRTTSLSPEEVNRLDAEYQRKLDELATLKAELQRLNNPSPSPEPAPTTYYPQNPPTDHPANRNWTAKGSTIPDPYQRPAPSNEQPTRYSAAYPPATSAAVPTGISFIPNTAYPDGAGYGGLDQLVQQVKSSPVVLEIRVHTPVTMERRAAQLLSEERAITIRDYLTEQGVPARNYRIVGYGNNLTGPGGERVEVFR